jgi:hypothetical protein
MMSLKKTQMKHIIENDIVKEVLKVFKGSKIIKVGDFTLEKKEEPIMAFANACKHIGWDTKLQDLTTDQVEGLIFIVQESGDITDGKDLNRLEQSHIKWSGGKYPPSSGIPF